MKTLKLIPHGGHVSPVYAPIDGATEGEWGKSTDAERPAGQVSGIVKRFKKNDEAAYNPQALGWIKAVYQEAIEYTGLTKELSGYPFFIGIFGALTGLIGLIGSLVISSKAMRAGMWQLLLFLPVFSIISFVFIAYILAFGLRLTLWQPADLPIIFDRRRRKIYRILREQQPGFAGMFKSWPIKVCEYDWDLIDAEHNAELYTTGGTVARNHYLMFVIRKSATDPTIIDSFQIGNAAVLSEELVPCMWEHIRRFMEENGPHLPSKKEPLANQDAPKSWWESLGTVGFIGPNYKKWWRDSPMITLIGHLILPLSGLINIIAGTGAWLSYKTATRIEWPQEVKETIGAKVYGTRN